MSETTIFIVCVACFCLITAIFVIVLVRIHFGIKMVWVALKATEANSNMLLEFVAAERERAERK